MDYSALATCALLVLAALALAQLPSGPFPSPPSPYPSAPPPHAFHTCHDYLKVEENADPRGNPGMQPCAATDAEMEEFYKIAMEPDLAYWRARAPLNRSKIDGFMNVWGHYGWHLHGFVLIHKNRWYFPFHTWWNHTQADTTTSNIISLWITASQYYFQKFAGEMEYPDVFFYMSDQDTGWCDSLDNGRCPIPAFSITKNIMGAVDLLFPFMPDCEHPLYNFPFQLKHKQGFFSGRPNWGASGKEFPGVPRFWSRQYMANLSWRHPDKLHAGIMADAAQYPQHLMAHQTPLSEHARWKYLLSLDGVTYSGRLAKIMHTNSVLLKEETIWPEYFVRAMREGVHYLPILKSGPDDVLEIMMQWDNRTSELQQIAFNAQQFALRFLCPKARMLYMRRLLTEYRNLFNVNGRNDMQDFIDEAIVPIIRARERGDMNTTWMGIPPWVPGR